MDDTVNINVSDIPMNNKEKKKRDVNDRSMIPIAIFDKSNTHELSQHRENTLSILGVKSNIENSSIGEIESKQKSSLLSIESNVDETSTVEMKTFSKQVQMELAIEEKRKRVVATFTTLPSRYECLIKSINSIREQDYGVDAIYLTVPKKVKRLDEEYPPLPNILSEICTIIRIDIDYGPITKLYGALISEKDPNTIIISCDDDVIYHPTMVTSMINNHIKYPNAAICATGALFGKGLFLCSIVYPTKDWKILPVGFNVSKEGRNIDILYGVTGALYRRGFFPINETLYSELFKYALENDPVFRNDDVLISGYLCKRNIKRRVFNDIPDVTHQSTNKTSALSYDFIAQMKSIDQSVNYLKQNGLFPYMEPLALDETIIGRTIIITILLFIILLIIILMYKSIL